MSERKTPTGKNQGEGNREADRNYREGVQQHVRDGDSKEAAERAKRALEGKESDSLKEAERKGREKARH